MKELKNQIRNILRTQYELPENQFTCISDIQLGQKSIIMFEYENRLEKWGLERGYTKYDINFMLKNHNREIYSLLCESDKLMFEKYLDFIKEYKTKNIIDGGDFLFHPNQDRLDYFEDNFDEKLQNFKKENSDSTFYLLIGNHDNIQYKNFYKKYFDKLVNYLYVFDDEENELIIFTHEPITEKTIHFRKFEEIKTLFNKFRGKIQIKNIHWHTHSNDIREEYDGKTFKEIEYLNMCIDKYIEEGIIA